MTQILTYLRYMCMYDAQATHYNGCASFARAYIYSICIHMQHVYAMFHLKQRM